MCARLFLVISMPQICNPAGPWDYTSAVNVHGKGFLRCDELGLRSATAHFDVHCAHGLYVFPAAVMFVSNSGTDAASNPGQYPICLSNLYRLLSHWCCHLAR